MSFHRNTNVRRNRSLQIESLENREMLDVTAAEFAQIRADNADLNLSANMSDYNVIEITADELSDGKLRDAITEAGATTANDLIVLRTTAEKNTITGSVLIGIDASQYGSITIVGFGTTPLTIDANQQSRVFYISFSEVGLAGLTITNGQAIGYGGGIHSYASNVTVTRSTISNNSAIRGEAISESHGGGLYAWDSTVVLNQVDFIENSSTAATSYGDGGGICFEESTATVTNSTFQGNSAWGPWGAQGGGCYTWDTNATFTNCVFVGNDASDNGVGAADYLSTGGGMSQAGGTVTLTNVTITGNRATEYGAGYYVDGLNGATAATTYIRNSIVALNTGVSEQYHTSKGGTTHSNNVLKTDPKFVQNPGSIGSQNYGNLQLQSSSPAVNKGKNTYVSGVSTDILGNARIANGTVDMGAYEYGGAQAVLQLPPGNVEASVTSGKETKSATITWTAPTGADYKTVYIVEYWDVNNPDKPKKVSVKAKKGDALTDPISKDLKLKAGTEYEFKVSVKGDKKTGLTDSEAVNAGKVWIHAVVPAASLVALKAKDFPAGFVSQSQVAVRVKNLTGNKVGTGNKAVEVDTLTVTYKDAKDKNATPKSAVFTLNGTTWTKTGGDGDVTFDGSIITVNGLKAVWKYTVTAKFSRETGNKATATKATSKTLSTTKTNWLKVENVRFEADASSGAAVCAWDEVKEYGGVTPEKAAAYTVKIWKGSKVVKKFTAKAAKFPVTDSLLIKYGNFGWSVTVTANADKTHVAGTVDSAPVVWS